MASSDKPNDFGSELKACARALARGYHKAAERHLAQAAHLGAPAAEVTRLGQAIRAAEKKKSGQNPGRTGIGSGFILAAAGYLLLALQQPLEWGLPLWIFLAFLLIPALVGLLIHRIQGDGRTAAQWFWSGMKATGWAMVFYAGISLIVLGKRLGRPDGAGEEFMAGTLVMLVYAAAAGSISGLVNMILSRRTAGAE